MSSSGSALGSYRPPKLPELPPPDVFRPNPDTVRTTKRATPRCARHIAAAARKATDDTQQSVAKMTSEEGSRPLTASVDTVAAELKRDVEFEITRDQQASRATSIAALAANTARTRQFVSQFRRHAAGIDARLKRVEAAGAAPATAKSGSSALAGSIARAVVSNDVLSSTTAIVSGGSRPGTAASAQGAVRGRFRTLVLEERVRDVCTRAEADCEAANASATAAMTSATQAQAAAEKAAAAALERVSQAEQAQGALQNQVWVLERRCAELQRQLSMRESDLHFYAGSLPVLDALCTKFHFSSPEDLIARLESLEERHVADFRETVDLHAERNALATEAASLRDKLRNSTARATSSLRTEIEELRATNRRLQERLADSEGAQTRARALEKEHLLVSASIVNLHDRWVVAEQEEDEDGSSSGPGAADAAQGPVALLRAVDAALVSRSRTAAGARLARVNAQTNKIWAKFFDDHSDEATLLRCDAPAILDRVYSDMLLNKRRLEMAEGEQAQLRSQLSAAQAKAAQYERRVRALRVEMNKKAGMFMRGEAGPRRVGEEAQADVPSERRPSPPPPADLASTIVTAVQTARAQTDASAAAYMVSDSLEGSEESAPGAPPEAGSPGWARLSSALEELGHPAPAGIVWLSELLERATSESVAKPSSATPSRRRH